MNSEILWVIYHPGTGERVECSTFEEAMDKWFEGHNIPRMVIDGKEEAFEVAHTRVSSYMKEHKP